MVWLVLLSIVVGFYRLFISPRQAEKARVAAAQQEKDKVAATSASGHYKSRLKFALDSFSGYCVFRSPEFHNELQNKSIYVELVDDNADYQQRMKSLQSGEVPIAAFTIDSLIKTSAAIGDVPGVIVSIIDETRGADAMVAYSKTVPNVDALNQSDTKFVLTPNSPSEMLSRVVMAHFNLKNINQNCFVQAKDAADVYRRYRESKPDTRQVFVLWEPFISKVLENPNCHRIVDSSAFRGYIVDVIVANRDFLYKNPEVVKDFVEAYLRASYACRQKMIALVQEDGKKTGTPVTETQATSLVNGIWWKNTQENYAHILGDQGLQHVEDMIINISRVLMDTGAVQSDPTHGQPNLFYYDKIVRSLKDSNFHPGYGEDIRGDVDLPQLSDADWQRLVPIGTLEVPELVFPRGMTNLSTANRDVLDDLYQKLRTWPQYYVLIKGNASTVGDLEANKLLATSRAKAAEEYLIEKGIDKNRVKAVGVEPSGSTSVSFILGQTPY